MARKERVQTHKLCYSHILISTYLYMHFFSTLKMYICLPTMVSINLHLYFPVTRSFQALFARFKCQYNDLFGLGLPGTYTQSFTHTSNYLHASTPALQHLSIVLLGFSSYFILPFHMFSSILCVRVFFFFFFFAASVDKPLTLLFV